MFKLESYVTPWLLGYLDQYVKLRPEDLQLSLWGGDAVLYNLDLRLDVLQKAMHLPIAFKSGHIHELRLHVPWTKLGSEPMVITINTVECIVKVRDTAHNDASSSASGSSAGKGGTSAGRAGRKVKRQTTEDLPPGYLQSILSRVVNNVTFIVNNLIVKFVEDDIVLSVNVKSAECYSCDDGWSRAFVDITPQDLTLRRMINFSDLTICLDKSSADGCIENYQEPMLYRCFIACRLHMTYESVNAKLPSQTKLNVMCDKLECLMSDIQLPMFLRLIEFCLALYYGYLDVPKDSCQNEDGIDLSTTRDPDLPLKVCDEGEAESGEEEDDQGWAAWMWSMVPQILPEGEEGEGYPASCLEDKLPIMSLGFYIQHASLVFKVTEQTKEKSRVRGHKLTFHPFLLLEAKGVGVEILMQGVTFFDAQCGVGHISLASLGPCICGHAADSSPQQSLILRCGESREGELAHDWGSLFDPTCAHNQGRGARYVVDREQHLQHYTEQYSRQRFAAFWMDYLSTLVLPHATHSGSQSSDTDSGDTSLFQQESSTCRFVFGPSQHFVTSTAVHRIHKLLCCAWNHNYEPYKNNATRQEGGGRVQVTEGQLAALEEFIPTCTYHLTLLQPSVVLAPATHRHCHVPTQPYSTRSHHHKTKPTSAVGEGIKEEAVHLCVSAERFDLQLLCPMYPSRLIRLVSNIAGPSSNLLHHCHSHTQFKVFNLQAGLQRPARRGVTWRPVILLPPCSIAFYFRSLKLPHLWNNSHLPVWERSYEVPQMNVTVSKASVMATVQLLATWTQLQLSSPPHWHSLLSDLFPQNNEEAVSLCVLELSICGLEVRNCHTPLVQAYTGSLSSLQLLLYTPGNDDKDAGTVLILHGPVDCSTAADITTFQQQPSACQMDGAECVTFTVQKPHHTSITEAPAVLVVSMEGVAGCMDPALLQWFSYTPRKHVRTLSTADICAAAVDVPLAQATSPLQTGGSHMSVRSGSSPQTTSRLFSHSHTPSHPRSHMEGSSSHGDSSHDNQLSSMDSITQLLVSTFPLLRMMHVQVDMKSSCVFVPTTSLGVREASSDIASNVWTTWRSGAVGEVLVLCLPAVSIHSVANTPMDVLQDIPITMPHGALLSEKLPWTVELSEWSAFTLHPGSVSRPLMRGLGVTSTVGATVLYNPPTSDLIHSLALCLHLDLRPPLISLSHSQVGLMKTFTELVGEVSYSGWELVDQCLSQLLSSRSTPASAGCSSSAAQQMEQSSSCVQQEMSLTGGTPEVGEAVTTDMSDEGPQHASPLHSILCPEPASDKAVKLSAWLQCVLPRFTLSLCTEENSGEVSIVVEDIAVSCDVQQVYCKVKTTVGSVSIHNFIHSAGGDRVKDSSCPVLVSTSRELPEHLNMHSNKVWTSDRQLFPAHFPPQENFTEDKLHGFFSLTFTRALCKSVQKKMKRLNVELTGFSEKEEILPSQGLFFHQFVREVCLKMEPVDVVVHLPTVHRLLSLWSAESRHSHLPDFPPVCSAAAPEGWSKTSSSMAPTLHAVPLVHVDVGAVRVFLPVECSSGNSAAGKPDEAAGSTLPHDFLLLQWSQLQVQPHADNPLPRYPVDREVFHQAMQGGMLQQTGSCVEDKQFQLQVHGLTLASGVWADVVHTQKEDSQKTQVTPGVQIPALEWNNYLGHRAPVEEILMIPMVTKFDVCLVMAPPIAYTGVDKDQLVLVCGLTAELNIVSDLDLQFSTQQLCLLTSLADQMTALSTEALQRSACEPAKGGPVAASLDSGVASELSAATRPDPWAAGSESKEGARIPANVLLTAGRISLTLYSHLRLRSDAWVSPAGPSASSRATPPPRSRGQPSAGKSFSADNFAWLTQAAPDRSRRAAAPEASLPFSLTQPQTAEQAGVKVAAGTVCVQPFVYIYLAQPHSVLSTWPAADRLELSCYDILVKGVRHDYLFPVTEQRVLPDHSDFSVHWVETRAGQPDCKTGIPPSLLTLHISHLLTLPVSVEVKLERPVRVSLHHDTVSQVTSFLDRVSPAVHGDGTEADRVSPVLHGDGTEADCVSPVLHGDRTETDHVSLAVHGDRTKTASSQQQTSDCVDDTDMAVPPAWLLSAMCTAKRVTVQTEQVVVSFECQDSSTTCGLVGSAEAITVAVEQAEEEGTQLKTRGSMCWKDVAVKTVYNKTQRPLAGPVTVETSALLRWAGKGQATPPQIVMGVQVGLLLLHVGQEHFMCLQHLLSVLHTTGDSVSVPKRAAAEQRAVPMAATLLTEVNPSHDDLRSGAFVYIHNESGGAEWPTAWQAVFSAGDEDPEVDSTLTWAYPQPRLITAITTLPVPFHLHTDHTDQHPPTVLCSLQHWDECVEEFVPYASFELHEDSSNNVHLPQLQPANIPSLAVARMWRVVLRPPTRPSPHSPDPPSGSATNTRQGVLLATQLAGSMCVDSVQVPSLVPSVQLSVTLAKLQLHLYNHLLYNGSGVGGQLGGYRLSSAIPQDQQWGVVSVDGVSLVSSHITTGLSRSSVQVSCEGAFEVVDFSSLTLQPVVDPVVLNATVSIQHHQQPSAVDIDIHTGHLHLHLGRSGLHTVNTSLRAWTQFGEKTVDTALLFAPFILCNNTQQTLRLGQAGTDENVVLHSGYMCPYSWRSYTAKQVYLLDLLRDTFKKDNALQQIWAFSQQLHLCLDHPTWRWCAPLDITTEGQIVRVVRARDQRYTLIIQIRNLSPIHKQVTVSGQFMVCSRLSQAVEVRFQLHEGEDGEAECVSLVEGGKPVPSFVIEHEDVRGVSVRLAGQHLPWSHTVHLSGNALHSNQLLKVLLPDGVSFIHVWCRVFCQRFGDTRQKLIFLSPLYVLRSHLPLPLHVKLLTPRTKQHQVLEVEGQGQEYQLHCSGGDVTHQLSFQLGPEVAESSPPVVLSTGLVDQVEQTAVTHMDLQALCEEQPSIVACDWPYTSLQSSSAYGEKKWSEVRQASVDVNVQLSQYLPGCNTLLVDIFPWCLLTNLTPLPLRLLSSAHHWALPPGCTVAPPALQELRLGCVHEGQVWEGPAIPLSGDEVEQHLYSPNLGKVLYLDGQVQLQLLLPPQTAGGLTQVVPLSVVSAVKHGMRVVTVSESLRLVNASGFTLQAQLMAVPQTSIRLQPSRFQVQSTVLPVCERKEPSECAFALLNWQLLQEEGLPAGATELVLYMALRMERQSAAGDVPSWSVPVRIASSQQGCRSTVAVAGEEGGACCLSLCLTCVVEGAQTYVVVSEDNSPMCWIHNLCPFPLRYGQALHKAGASDATVQEETELVDTVPTVASGGWSLYTMPEINAQFPRVDTRPPPCLHVRAVLPGDPPSAGYASARQSEWSIGIALNAGDTFLRMNGVANIKVNIQLLSMVHHVTFSVLNKAEVSAREVRSRIQGGQQVTRVEGQTPIPAPSSASSSAEQGADEARRCLDTVVVRQPLTQSVATWPPVSVGLLLKEVVVTLHDDVSQATVITQLLQVALQQVLLACYPVGGSCSSLCMAVCVGNMQVDNPLAHQGLHDFPVILRPQQQPSALQARLPPQLHLTEVHAMLRARSCLHLQLLVSKDPLLRASWFLDSVEVAVKPLSIYFEDSYFFRLYEECLCLSPQQPGGCGSQGSRQCVPPSVWESARLHQQPLRIRHLCVQPVSLLLSVHASVRLFLATDHAPLTLGRFERHHLFTGTQQLAYTMAVHYITAAIFRAGMVVGSMDLLGSPTGLVRSVSTGLSDLLRLPYQGLMTSPTAFLSGILGGVSSLMRNVTAGMVTSVTNFASSVSRNMDRLSLDSGHLQRQEETRRHRPQGLSSGLHQGLTGFGLSLLGAVAGLVDQPLQSVLAQQSVEKPPSASSTAGSIMVGMGKGLVGVVTKPIGGVAELVSQAGQGILQGSGLRQRVGPHLSITETQRLHLPTAWLKYPMKLLAETSLLLAVSGTQQDIIDEARQVVLLLTGDMVVVVSQEEDAQQQAFALSQLDCQSPAPAILMLTVTDNPLHNPAQLCTPSSEDRVAAFINSTTNLNQPAEPAPSPSSDNVPVMVDTTSPLARILISSVEGEQAASSMDASPAYHFRLEPYWCQLFVALFHMARNRQMGRGFMV